MKKETEIIEGLNELDFALHNARRKAARTKDDILKIENKIKRNTQKSHALESEIRQSEEYALKRMTALYKLNQLGKLNLLASVDSLYEFIHRKTNLEKILNQDDKTLCALNARQQKLQLVIQALKNQKTEKNRLENDLKVLIQNISEKREKRAYLLNEVRSKKSLALAAIASLRRSADELKETITGFKKEFPGTMPYADSSARSFSDLKGLLIMPVRGRIIKFFGPYTNTKFNIVNFRSGINIQAERGEPIHAVYKGITLYASWFKGYGNMIIIDHGDHYYTLYAHAEELFKKKGDLVEAGEVIATVGDTGSLSGSGLHFEVRHHGNPIDPMPWINQG